jgi:hypothetical protein
MPTFDRGSFGTPISVAEGNRMGAAFAVLALMLDLLFVLVVAKEASERGANVLGWAVLTLVLPFVGYAIWKASTSREDHPPDMSIVLRERARRRRSTAPPPASAAPPSQRTRRRPRTFF